MLNLGVANTISVLLGSGTGGFGPKTDLAAGLARCGIQAHRIDYNEVRPHGSLSNRTPAEFAAAAPGA